MYAYAIHRTIANQRFSCANIYFVGIIMMRLGTNWCRSGFMMVEHCLRSVRYSGWRFCKWVKTIKRAIKDRVRLDKDLLLLYSLCALTNFEKRY